MEEVLGGVGGGGGVHPVRVIDYTVAYMTDRWGETAAGDSPGNSISSRIQQ